MATVDAEAGKSSSVCFRLLMGLDFFFCVIACMMELHIDFEELVSNQKSLLEQVWTMDWL